MIYMKGVPEFPQCGFSSLAVRVLKQYSKFWRCLFIYFFLWVTKFLLLKYRNQVHWGCTEGEEQSNSQITMIKQIGDVYFNEQIFPFLDWFNLAINMYDRVYTKLCADRHTNTYQSHILFYFIGNIYTHPMGLEPTTSPSS